MSRLNAKLYSILVCTTLFITTPVGAQTAVSTEQSHGTLVVVPAYGEVTHANDQAHVTLSIEEQDKDKASAASRVNLKMKQGIEIVKQGDPSATLKTRGYYTYAVYDSGGVGSSPNNNPKQAIGWRVGQYLGMVQNHHILVNS
jgi:uncharacterized protein YggE